VSDLIDTTEMYLRTIFELEEEGITPLRARIAERLGQSGPTVSQTVARMERDGLLAVEGDRHLELSDDGRAMATRVMRKHRLAECLLVEVIGLQWEDVHAEACRWEHVMSETVERRILEILGHPTVSPYGNPIPGLGELDQEPVEADLGGLTTLDKVARDASTRVTVVRIGEPVQTDAALMASLRRAGALPGATVKVVASPGGLLVGSAGEYAELDSAMASHVFVAKG
jgi:DtxR family Mn-dependent transcriptional regulator